MSSDEAKRNRHFLVGLARAFAGAVIFALPLLMTMEMWWLGFYMPPGKLALLLALFFPFLVALSWHVGFEPTFSLRDDVVDALVAYAVGFVSSALVLSLIGQLDASMSAREILGKVSLQAVPASIGALLSQAQLGDRDATQVPRGGEAHYWSELFLMAVGALFLSFHLAPTDEVWMIATGVPTWGSAALIVVTLVAMHAFVYVVAFRGRPEDHENASAWSVFLRFTVTGYGVVFLVSAYILWTYGRLDGMALAPALQNIAVMAFPAAIGAAAARLIL